MQGLISGDRGASRLPIYEQITRGIRVRVLPNFLADQSDPEECRFLWSYTVTIENRGEETVQLIARYWQITDEAGRMQEVRGPGRGRSPAGARAGPELRIYQRLPAADGVRRHERALPDARGLRRGLRGRYSDLPPL